LLRFARNDSGKKHWFSIFSRGCNQIKSFHIPLSRNLAAKIQLFLDLALWGIGFILLVMVW
jgi:hypothetical protein